MSNTATQTISRAAKGRLIGWLVTYAGDATGKAHELRAGRIFLGSSSNSDEKMIALKDEGIEALHLVLSASRNHKLMAMDLFTDSGSFISRVEVEQETKISSPTQLRHGDWIRIGENTRFQVCLIDGPSK